MNCLKSAVQIKLTWLDSFFTTKSTAMVVCFEQPSNIYWVSLACCATYHLLTLCYTVNFSNNTSARSRGCDIWHNKLEKQSKPNYFYCMVAVTKQRTSHLRLNMQLLLLLFGAIVGNIKLKEDCIFNLTVLFEEWWVQELALALFVSSLVD